MAGEYGLSSVGNLTPRQSADDFQANLIAKQRTAASPEEPLDCAMCVQLKIDLKLELCHMRVLDFVPNFPIDIFNMPINHCATRSEGSAF